MRKLSGPVPASPLPIEGDWKDYVPRMVATCSIRVPWVASARVAAWQMHLVAILEVCSLFRIFVGVEISFFQPCPNSHTGPCGDPWGGRHLNKTSYHRPATCTFQILQFKCLTGMRQTTTPGSSPHAGLGFSVHVMRQSSRQLILGSKN